MKRIDTNRLNGEIIALETCDSSTVSKHSHSFFEFVYVLRGKAEHTINGRTMILSEGDYFLIDLEYTHEYRKLKSEADFCIINCMFLPEIIDDSLKDAKSFREIITPYMPDFPINDISTLTSYHDQDGFIGALVTKMLREHREKKSGYLDVMRNSLLCMLICLARSESSVGNTGTGHMIKHIKDYVEKHYTERIQLSDICKNMNFSLTYLSLTFKKETNMTFRDYLIKVRLEKACHLLRTTDKTIAEVSDLVGYSDPAFFFKIFKKELGVTPYHYRKIQK